MTFSLAGGPAGSGLRSASRRWFMRPWVRVAFALRAPPEPGLGIGPTRMELRCCHIHWLTFRKGRRKTPNKRHRQDRADRTTGKGTKFLRTVWR